ncbi:MAG TPA: FHA domain-containing protein [Phycisphaerae bacterium]|nr:FHA domain-containing protein [Phycisphaerae bacterium]
MSSKTSDKPAPLDPYSEFLQLPPGPRPPHLYDLLGVELFCAQRERLEHAAREQYRRIKQYQEHPQRDIREAVQDVITRIANARIMLTNPAQKEEYDKRLAERLDIDRDAVVGARTAARLPEYALRVVAGPERVGTMLPLLPDQALTIGSAVGSGLQLTGLRMAPRHVELKFANEAWMLHVADRAITLVNDQRVDGATLNERDAIDLGGYRLQFDRIDARPPNPGTVPPPLSLVIREGPSVIHPTLYAIAPAAILIGTCDTALWQLVGRPVAVHHARVEPSGALWEITDLHSDTGTFHNGEKVRSAILSHRDRLTIGRFDIQVTLRR